LTIPPPKGLAVPMTLEEVSIVVDDHDKTMRYLTWGVAILAFLVWVLLVTRR
jgi:hypothetical protein